MLAPRAYASLVAVNRPRGRPKADETKVFTATRLDADLLQTFKATGEGWQTCVNAALRQFECCATSVHYRTRFGTLIGRIHVDALTAKEAQLLVGFRAADEIRNRLLEAQQEVDLRLRSKGISGVFGAQDSCA